MSYTCCTSLTPIEGQGQGRKGLIGKLSFSESISFSGLEHGSLKNIYRTPRKYRTFWSKIQEIQDAQAQKYRINIGHQSKIQDNIGLSRHVFTLSMTVYVYSTLPKQLNHRTVGERCSVTGTVGELMALKLLPTPFTVRADTFRHAAMQGPRSKTKT